MSVYPVFLYSHFGGNYLKKFIKSIVGAILVRTGLHKVFLKDRAIVVAFHRVNDQYNDGLTYDPRKFELFCRFARRYYEVVSLSDIVQRLESNQSVGGLLAITFDDGYEDNFSIAAPVLSNLELPATFFIASEFIGSSIVPWWDEPLDPSPKWMNWEQVQSLVSSGFEIGGHTSSHADLGEISGEHATQEIEDGRKILEDHINVAVDLFAYPYGRPENITDDNRRLVEKAGFRCCVSCHGGTIGSGNDPFRLSRVPISSWYSSPSQFAFETIFG